MSQDQEQMFDPFATTGVEKLPPKIMAKDHQGHSTNVRMKLDPRVHAELSKRVALRMVDETSVADLMRALMARGLAQIADETGDFELSDLMRIQSAAVAMEQLKQQEAASHALIEQLRTDLREIDDDGVRDQLLMLAVGERSALSEKWQARMDEVLYPYRHLIEGWE